jgi:hypothetical protein
VWMVDLFVGIVLKTDANTVCFEAFSRYGCSSALENYHAFQPAVSNLIKACPGHEPTLVPVVMMSNLSAQ